MAEQIEMPFGLMTRLGPRYHVLHEGPSPPREETILGESISNGTIYGALCKNGWTDRRAILDEDSAGPIEPIIRCGCRSLKGNKQFLGLFRHSKACAIFPAPDAAASLQKGSFNRQ